MQPQADSRSTVRRSSDDRRGSSIFLFLCALLLSCLYPCSGPVVLAALLKRLNHKKHTVGIASVLLLEALVKNCPPIVPLVADPEFMNAFVKVLPKQVRDPHNKGLFAGLKDSTRDILAVERFDQILLLIQSWATAFPPESPAVTRDRRLLIFTETFRNLQRAGVKFPAPNLDELAPVATPQKNSAVLAAKAAEHRKHLEALAEAERAQHEKQAFKFIDPECASIADTCTLLTDMLTQSNEREDLRRNELIQQILSALKPNAAKISQRLGVEANAARPNEKMLAELLQANEIAMEAVGYYEGLVSGKMKRRAPAAAAPAAAATRPAASASSSSSASSPAPSPGGLAGAPPAHPKGSARAVPLLQPPPASAAASSSSSYQHRHGSSPAKSRASAGSPARASPAAAPVDAPAPSQPSLLDMDLLFSAPPAANQPQQQQHQHQQQQARSFFDQPQHPHPHAAPASSPVNPAAEGVVSPPGYDEQQRLHALAVSKLPAHKQQQAAGSKPAPAPKSSFVLAPPPAAAGPAADFFSSAAGSAAPAAHQPHRGAGSAAAAAPAAKTPFDSPDEDDPWMSVATRSSPPAAQQPPVDDFANFGFK